MIYFDNASTGGFKISAVTETATNLIKHLNANPGRSSHRLSIKGAELVYNARKTIATTFNAPSENNVVFTANCTQALNTAIFGTVRRGGHVITTVYEHNSVLRPLRFLESINVITLTIVKPINGDFTKPVLDALQKNTYLVVINGASNVTGEVTLWQDLALPLKAKGVLLLIDGAQLAGHKKIDLASENISMLALAGHKALGGIAGSGALILGENVECEPFIMGGTGTETFSTLQPRSMPERLESGSLNLPAIASFGEAVEYSSSNILHFSEMLLNKTEYLIDALKRINGCTVYSKPNQCGIVSFNLRGYPSSDLSYMLSENFDIATRGGYHCAPLMHEFLGTKKSGTVRVSLCAQNVTSEIDELISAIKSI